MRNRECAVAGDVVHYLHRIAVCTDDDDRHVKNKPGFDVCSDRNIDFNQQCAAVNVCFRLLDGIGNRGERRRFGTVAFLLRLGVDKVTEIDLETDLADLARLTVDTRDRQEGIARLRIASVGDRVVNILGQQRNAVTRPHDRFGGASSACPHIQILVGNRLDIEVPRPQGEDHGSRATVAATILTTVSTGPAATAATTTETIGAWVTWGPLSAVAAAARSAESRIEIVISTGRSAAATAATIVNRFAGDAAHDAFAAVARALDVFRVLVARMARAAAAAGSAEVAGSRASMTDAGNAGTSGTALCSTSSGCAVRADVAEPAAAATAAGDRDGDVRERERCRLAIGAFAVIAACACAARADGDREGVARGEKRTDNTRRVGGAAAATAAAHGVAAATTAADNQIVGHREIALHRRHLHGRRIGEDVDVLSTGEKPPCRRIRRKNIIVLAFCGGDVERLLKNEAGEIALAGNGRLCSAHAEMIRILDIEVRA